MSNQLESVHQQFQQWKSQQIHGNTTTPNEIKRAIVNLLSTYSASYLSRYFGLGNSTISSWRRKLSTEGDQDQPQSFIELTTPIELNTPDVSHKKTSSDQEMIEITFIKNQIDIHASLSIQQFNQLFLRQEI